MATLSLKERVNLINSKHSRFAIHRVTDFKLRQKFKSKGIGFKQVRIRRCWRRPDDSDKLEKDELAFKSFKRDMDWARCQNMTVVSVDESVFHQRICVQKSWAPKGPPSYFGNEPSPYLS